MNPLCSNRVVQTSITAAMRTGTVRTTKGLTRREHIGAITAAGISPIAPTRGERTKRDPKMPAMAMRKTTRGLIVVRKAGFSPGRSLGVGSGTR